jgi:hypothetical protein
MSITHNGLRFMLLPLALVAACGGAQTPAASVPASSAAAPAAAAPGADAKAAAPGSSAPTVVWDGEKNGPTAKGWASCPGEKEGKCKVEAKPGAGRNGTTGLVFKAKGAEWMGFGWNWFGWYPDNSGIDVTGYKNLSFWVKLTATKAPDASGIKVLLGCSSKDKAKEQSNEVALGNYVKNLSDGQWHEVKIPVSELLTGDKGKAFDAKKAWEFRIGAWYQDEQDYTITVDDIGFN